jgi:hypothetical protein
MASKHLFSELLEQGILAVTYFQLSNISKKTDSLLSSLPRLLQELPVSRLTLLGNY